MIISVLVPSEEYKSYAGARIRYQRVAPKLAALGIDLELVDIATFDPASRRSDVLVISKCHDARSLVAAAVMTQRGVQVGVDLFDDYFSDPIDSRLLRYRDWLRQLTGICNFCLCSTEVMADVASDFQCDIPIHLLRDPAPQVDLKSLAELLRQKAATAREKQHIQAAWFGIGDNPYFPVGLADLSAFGTCVRRLARGGMDVSLTVLTNTRALTSDRLSLIARLPVKAEVREWSESVERQVLSDAFVAILPINARPFSAAKSLNRAVTALSAGCQILSLGYPLYAPLDSLIYRRPEALVRDLFHNCLRLTPQSLNRFSDIIDRFANAEVEAQRLATFITALRRSEPKVASLICVVHGHSTPADVQRLASSCGALSVASPYCSSNLDFDIVFRGALPRLEMLVSRKALQRLRPDQATSLKRRERVHGQDFTVLGSDRCEAKNGAPPSGRHLAFELASYAATMTEIERRLTDAFGGSTIIHSEQSAFPFGLAGVM